MSTDEWSFFTSEQNPCGVLDDPLHGKMICKLKQGTAYCRVRCIKGYMYENTKKRTQWCRQGHWYPRKTPQCVPDPLSHHTGSKSRNRKYEYGRSTRSRLNPDIAEMIKLLGESEFSDIPAQRSNFDQFNFFEETGNCKPRVS